MNNRIKCAALLTYCTLLTVPMQGYMYRFYNKTNATVQVQWQLAGINEPTNTVQIAPQGYAEKNIDDFGRTGLCILLETFEIRLASGSYYGRWQEPYLTKSTPVLYDIVSKNTLQQAIATIRAIDKISTILGPILCFDQTMTILKTSDGVPIIHMGN